MTEKHKPLHLREHYGLKIPQVADSAHVSPTVVYRILMGYPVYKQEANKVLQAISHFAGQEYTLENVEVALYPDNLGQMYQERVDREKRNKRNE